MWNGRFATCARPSPTSRRRPDEVTMPLQLAAAAFGRAKREFAVLGARAHNGLRYVAGVRFGDIAVTPRQEVWSRDKVVLYRYRQGAPSRRTPVLLVMSLVTRPYVFD